MFGLGFLGVQDESRALVSLSAKKKKIISKLQCLVFKNTDFGKGKKIVWIKMRVFLKYLQINFNNRAILSLNSENGCKIFFINYFSLKTTQPNVLAQRHSPPQAIC